MSFEPNTAGGRIAPRAGEPLQWPLLARLPHAGRASGAAERASYPAAPPEPGRLPSLIAKDTDPLSLYAENAARVSNPALDLLNRRQTAQPPGQAAAIKPPHVAVAAYDWPELDGDALPADRTPPPRREYLRVDAPDARHVHGTHGRQVKDSLAARAFQWHSAFAPHAGVAVTVALILSATLLYWLTLGNGRTAVDYDNFLDPQNTWSSEDPLQSRIAAEDQAARAAGPSFELAPSSSPFPRMAEAAPETASPEIQPSVSEPVAAVDAAPNEESTPSDESAAITPTPSSAPYPVTDYVSLDFALPGAVEPVAASEPAATAPPAAPDAAN